MSLKTLNKKQKTFCFSLLFVISSSITYFTLDSSILRYYYNDITDTDVVKINSDIKKQEEVLSQYTKERTSLYATIQDENISKLDKKIAINNLYQKLSKIDEGTANVLLYFPTKEFDSALSEKFLSRGLLTWQDNSAFKKYLNFMSICNKKWYCTSFVYDIMLYKKNLIDYRQHYQVNIEAINSDIQQSLINEKK